MTRLVHSRCFPSTPEHAFATLVPVPLENLLGRRFLLIPGVSGTDGDEPWGQRLGQRRTLRFTDGGTARETVVELDQPRLFAYTLGEATGPMRALFRGITGRWEFAAVETGTRVTWSWDVDPTLLGRALMPAFSHNWRGAARRAFDRIGPVVTNRARP